MALDLNVKNIQPIKGLTVYEVAPSLHNVIVANGTLKAGDFVKLNASSTNIDAAEVVAAGATDAVFGIVKFTPVKNSFVAGDKVAIAQSGCVVWCEAAAAIAVGAELYHTAENKVTSTNPGSGTKYGVALTCAANAGDLIQVQL